MKRFVLITILASLAAPAMAQNYDIQTMPLGGGWQQHTGTKPDGTTFNGTEMPLGGGWSVTNWQDSRGRQTTCTTMPLGGGWATTSCQ